MTQFVKGRRNDHRTDPFQRQEQKNQGQKKACTEMDLNQPSNCLQKSKAALIGDTPPDNSSANSFNADTAMLFPGKIPFSLRKALPSGHKVSTRNRNSVKNRIVSAGTLMEDLRLNGCFCMDRYTIR